MAWYASKVNLSSGMKIGKAVPFFVSTQIYFALRSRNKKFNCTFIVTFYPRSSS